MIGKTLMQVMRENHPLTCGEHINGQRITQTCYQSTREYENRPMFALDFGPLQPYLGEVSDERNPYD